MVAQRHLELQVLQNNKIMKGSALLAESFLLPRSLLHNPLLTFHTASNMIELSDLEGVVMLEMELKARLKNKENLMQNLTEKECVWKRTICQEDIIYIQQNTGKTVNTPVFRIRKIDEKTILTLKIQAADLNTAKELELEVSDKNIMHQILQTIGFDAKVELKKKRTETEYKGYTICIDEVERLGDFIEIEKLAEEAQIDAEYAHMWTVLEELGIQKEDLEEKKYFEMIQRLEE